MSNAEPDPVGPGSVDADGIDQAIPAPPPHRQSVNDKLKAEAISAAHQLSHLPKNPFCDACLFGKMKEKYSHRRTFKRENSEWGETITRDHIYSASCNAVG